MCDLAISLLTMFIGACVAWFATWFYYKRAAQQLDAAAAELRRLNNLLLHGMEDAGWIELNRDPDSNKITGFRISVAGTSQGKATVSGTLEIQHDAESPLCGSFNDYTFAVFAFGG